jgi:hypothetical protein
MTNFTRIIKNRCENVKYFKVPYKKLEKHEVISETNVSISTKDEIFSLKLHVVSNEVREIFSILENSVKFKDSLCVKLEPYRYVDLNYYLTKKVAKKTLNLSNNFLIIDFSDTKKIKEIYSSLRNSISRDYSKLSATTLYELGLSVELINRNMVYVEDDSRFVEILNLAQMPDRYEESELDKIGKSLLINYLGKVDLGLINPRVVNFFDWSSEISLQSKLLPRFLYDVYCQRADLQMAFSHDQDNWRIRLVDWFINFGSAELGLKKIFTTKKMLEIKKSMTIASKEIFFHGYFRKTLGLGEAAWIYSDSLFRSGAKVNFLENQNSSSPRSNRKLVIDRKLTNVNGVNIIGVNPDQLKTYFHDLGFNCKINERMIGIWFWELGSLSESHNEMAKHFRQIWASSKFNYDLFSKELKTDVFHVPIPIHANSLGRSNRKFQGIGGNYFLVIFDFLSDFNRKNPLAAVDAFISLYPRSQNNCQLIIKTTNSRVDLLNSKLLWSKISNRMDILWFDGPVSSADLNQLIHDSSAYISPHRSEGYGLNIAKSILLKTPVIMTNYSGPTDFVTDSSSFLIDYKLVAVDSASTVYKLKNAKWADPSIQHISESMERILYSDYEVKGKVEEAFRYFSQVSDVKKIDKIIKNLIKSV